MTAARVTLPELVGRLLAPQSDAPSAVGGTPAVAVEIAAGDLVAPAALAAAAARMATLACPSIALAPKAPPAELRAFVAACDVVVATEAELEACVAAAVANPLAAATLVRVLRASAALAPTDGLVLESLAYATLQAGPEFARWLAARPRWAAAVHAGPGVRITRAGDTLAVTLDRPERHNAYSARMRDALAEAFALAVADPTLAVVVRGAGPSFCSGGDLDEFGTCPDPATAHLVRTTRSPARLLAEIAPRVRMEVHGACIGAGIELAAFAGRVVARSDAFFQLPEIGMGLVPGAGGTVSLPRRIGRQRTTYLALSGQRLDAATAERWGLVDAIAGREDPP